VETELKLRRRSVGSVFTPARPISTGALFAGRFNQIITVQHGIIEEGRHVIIYGERGVGKTSLANMVELIAKIKQQGTPRSVVKITCSRYASFGSLWEAIFQKIPFTTQVATDAGFAPTATARTGTMRDLLPLTAEITPEVISYYLGIVSQHVGAEVVIIIDELDRLRNSETLVGIADVLKNLSDNYVPTTLVLVGIADSVDQLVAEHASLPRSLVQVRIPRMSPKELFEIMDKGFKELSMRIDAQAKRVIAALSQGLPHYVHLLAKHAAEAAISQDDDEVTSEHVASAVRTAIENAAESTRNAYYRATLSAQDNRFKEVLLACALAREDEMGFFSPSDVRTMMCEIAGDQYNSVSFARRLSEFCTDKRGAILQQTGRSRNFRYRFTDPLMEPFIVLKGLSERLIDEDTIARVTRMSSLPLDIIYDDGIESILVSPF
jgi:Cdc6-like AAA superfamily ATPase